MKKILFFFALLGLLIVPSYAAEELHAKSEITFRNHTYKLFDESLSWHEARDYCASIGGYLATITGKEEQEVLKKLIDGGNKKQYWLGGMHEKKGASWQWITDEPWEFTNWYLSPDDTQNKLYLQIYRLPGVSMFAKPYKWNYINAQNSLADKPSVHSLQHVGFICEFGKPFTPGETYFGSRVSDWALYEVEEAYTLGLLPSTLLGQDLTQKITRAEFAALSVLLYEELSGTITFATQSPFTDIQTDPNASYIKSAYLLGITVGVSDTEFSPNASIWREQLAAMLCRTIKKYAIPDWDIKTDEDFPTNMDNIEKYLDHHEISEYAVSSVYYLTEHGIINGILPRVFSPKKTSDQSYADNLGTATREQAIAMAMRIVRNKAAFAVN